MSKRDIRLYLHDMLNAISKVERFTAGLDYERFESNEMVIDAVVRNLEVIGEAARNIPPDLRARYTEIEWPRIIGFRNIAIHAYFVVDLQIVRSAPVETSSSEHAGEIGGRLVILWGSLR